MGVGHYPSDFPGYSKTATLMHEMTKPVHHTGKVVSMDSGFCISVGITAMHNFGVYGQSLMKKQRYLPKKVPDDAIDSYFANKVPKPTQDRKSVGLGT